MTDPSIADPPSPYSPALVAKPAPVVRPVAARTKLLLEGPIFATLLRLAAPNILNLIAFVAVIIFDGLFLGRIGTDALAGVSWPSCFCGRRKLLHAKGKKQSPLETSVQRLRSTRFVEETCAWAEATTPFQASTDRTASKPHQPSPAERASFRRCSRPLSSRARRQWRELWNQKP